MMKVLLSTCLLLILLSPVKQPYVNETCESNQTCASLVLNNNIVPKHKMETFRGCTKITRCHPGNFSISSANGKFLQMKVFCCHTNECNKEPIHIPAREDVSPNGRQCPACFSLVNLKAKHNCESQGNVSCLANETKCFDFSGLTGTFLQTYKLKFQGCATEDFCTLNGKNLQYQNIVIGNIKAKCYNAEESSKQIDLKG